MQNDAGLAKTRPRHHDWDAVLNLWAVGVAGREISECLCVTHSTVLGIVRKSRKAGDVRAVRRKRKPVWTDATVLSGKARQETVLNLWADCQTSTYIADLLDIPRGSVLRIVHEARVASDPRAASRPFQGMNR